MCVCGSWQGVLSPGQVSAHDSGVTVALYRGKEKEDEGGKREEGREEASSGQHSRGN